jgi:hypothetical protein
VKADPLRRWRHPNTATPSRFMHNGWRNVNATIPGEDDPNQPGDQTKGMVLYGTEENITANCASSGRFATYDLRGSFNGEGWKSTSVARFRMRVLDTWTPQGEAGSTGCASAHYLDDRGDFILAYAFYGQGTRFLDVSNPKDIRQIGYFRPNGASTWAPYWYNGYVFVADNARGIDILRFNGEAGDAAVEYLRFGYAGAMTMVMFVVTAGMVGIQLLALRRWRGVLARA